ncbi:MAG: acyltransferase [Acidimicrobiales bacterium]
MADLRADHLHEIDVVRILTFGAVVAVHAIAFTERPSNVVAAGALMLLQFGRELFFALMGFVLVHSALRRYPGARSFWRRRFPFVAMPYVAWTVLYWLDGVATDPHHTVSVGALLTDLRTGGAEYHLYFLLVTLQLYLAFPLLLRFVQATASRAWPVLAGVGVANLAWLSVHHTTASPSGPAGALWDRSYELLPTYALYVLAGCYAAVHLPGVQDVVRRRGRAVVGVALGAAGLALVAYVAQLPGRAPRDAADVLQPAMALTCLAAALLLYVAGARWAAGDRRHQHAVRTASDISFGVYLAHPLVLQLLLAAGLGNNGQRLPAPVATVVAFAGATVGSALLTLAARRTPLSLALTGRRRLAPSPLPQLTGSAEERLRVFAAGQATIAP